MRTLPSALVSTRSWSTRATAAAAMTAPAFARVEAHRDVAAVLDAWAALEASAPCSIYQTRAFLLPWIETLAAPAGLTPVFVLARGADAQPAALLCLGLRRHGPLRIAHWLGGRDSNFNMPLVARGRPWSRRDVVALLRAAHRALAPEAPDLYALANQPFAWHDTANPMALLRHQPSPSAAYATPLMADAEAFFSARLSSDTRRKLRKKEKRLAALGPVTQIRGDDPATRARLVDAFLALRNARFHAQAIASPFEAPAMRAFIVAASEAASPGIELHALAVGERIVAVCGGAGHQGQWSGMFTAFDMDATFAQRSPGELLTMRLAADACRAGYARFDLGIGASRYKIALCHEEVALFDAFVPMTAAGRVLALGLAARHALKRTIKANPRLLKAARRAASLLFRLRRTAAGEDRPD